MESVGKYTTVNASGSAKAAYNMVTFNVRVEGDGKTLAEAKQMADELMRAVDGCVKTLVDTKKLLIELGTEQRTSSSRTNRDSSGKGKKEIETTKYSYLYSFTSNSVECASAVMDEIGSLVVQGVQVVPVYKVRNLRALSKLAFANAIQNAKERFTDECHVMRVDPKCYAIDNYIPTYDESRGYQGSGMESAGMRSMMALDTDSSPIQLDPGTTEIKVRVSVTYIKKPKLIRQRKCVAKKK